MKHWIRRWIILGIMLAGGCGRSATITRAPAPLPVVWERPIDRPVISLGKQGQFDSNHVFAPSVMRYGKGYRMFYPGSGPQPNRLFEIGIADSENGLTWTKYEKSPVIVWEDQVTSLVTPALVRALHGEAIRVNGRLQMYLIAVDFNSKERIHRLYATSSVDDGLTWTALRGPLMENIYAPSVLKINGEYRMWYTDVSRQPWCFRLARSEDGTHWSPVQADPVLVVDQAWEKRNLFYPHVLYEGDRYLMWYGSYWSARDDTTALGLAVSEDGIRWRKHERNPIIRPDPARAFESNYCTSETVLPLCHDVMDSSGSPARICDGYQIWYGTRNRDAQKHKYFAICTAVSVP